MKGIRIRPRLSAPMIIITSASALVEVLNGAIWYQKV
jgi:hypothetical protein